MFGWGQPMGRRRFAAMMAMAFLAMPMVAASTPGLIRLLPFVVGRGGTVIAGLVLMVFAVILFLLCNIVVVVSTARRLKDLGVTRWLAPLGLLSELVVGLPRVFSPGAWESTPILNGLAIAVALWLAFLVLAPGRTGRRTVENRAAEFA